MVNLTFYLNQWLKWHSVVVGLGLGVQGVENGDGIPPPVQGEEFGTF